jgi:catechol 2,3-dioxygenase-like lactoylglutathione lyase family enzyme
MMVKDSITEFITFIYVADLSRSRQFYEDILGFDLVLDQGLCRIVRVSGSDGLLGYCSREGRSGGDQNMILTLVTQQVDDWYKYLVDQGITISEPPQINPGFNIYHFFLNDPDGYKWEIQEFLNSDWNRQS